MSGSVEALEDALLKIDVGEEVSLRVIGRGVGAITEDDVNLAIASDAVIVGFNVRPEGKARELAEREKVDVRYYSVIYQAIEDVESALKGMLKPEYEEVQLGTAEIREVFRSSKLGNIAGCIVRSGTIVRNSKARLVRDGVVVADNVSIGGLRRFKDDVTGFVGDDVVLEPAQRVHGQVVRDHHAVPDQPGLAAAVDRAGPDQAARDVADPRHPEDLPDLGRAQLGFLELGLEHALEGRLDLLDRLVDDRVVADVHTLALGQLTGPARRADVEADDHRLGGDGQVHVVLGDGADTTADDPQADLLADIDLEQRVLQGLDRPGHVALDDEQELFPLAGLERGLQVLEGDPGTPLREHRAALPGFPALRDLAGHPVVPDDEEVVARVRDGGEAEHLHRAGRRRIRGRRAVVIQQRPDPAERLARHDGVTDPQRAPLDQHGRHRAAAAVQVGLDGHPLGRLVRVGPQVKLGIRGQHDRLEQVLDAAALPGGDIHEQGRATELLGDQAVLGELRAHPGRVRALLVDLVHRDDNRHPGRLGVVERLGGLRLHAVIRGHDEDHQVGGFRAARPHGGERLVTRGVDEGDLALLAVHLGGHLVGADVLGDAAGFAGRHVGVPDRVEQLGLAVVHMAHHGDHRRAGDQGLLATLVLTELDVRTTPAAPGPLPRGRRPGRCS